MGNLWMAEWYSNNRLDGKKRHLMFDDCLPKIFRTRRSCRDWIKEKYGYIKDRVDLKEEPHGWRLPVAVKVNIDKIEED